MKKKLLIISILILINLTAFSQWEFTYFVFRFGANHQMFSPQPDSINNFYLNTTDGEMKLLPDTTFFMDYVPGFHVDLHFHIDFANDKGGIVAGIEYLNMGVSEKYVTVNELSLIRTFRMHSIGIPLYIKFGNQIFNKQKYFFGGVQYNINFAMQLVEKTSIQNTQLRYRWNLENEIEQNNLTIFIGFNFLVFNFEFDFMPKTFLNRDYTINVGDENNPQIIKPYKCQINRIFLIKTSINIPISKWTTNRSPFLRKIVRIIKH